MQKKFLATIVSAVAHSALLGMLLSAVRRSILWLGSRVVLRLLSAIDRRVMSSTVWVWSRLRAWRSKWFSSNDNDNPSPPLGGCPIYIGPNFMLQM